MVHRFYYILMLLNNKGERYMKPIRFTLHYMGQALYKLWNFIWEPLVVIIGWYSVGYLMSRLSVFRNMFDKGTLS